MFLEKTLKDPIGVFGLGIEGFAVANYFKNAGHPVILFDEKKLNDFSESEQKKIQELSSDLRLGDLINDTSGFKTLFRSPGIPLNHQLINSCIKEGKIITSQTKWFFEHCPATIIGVTGTKGKGTTSSLIYEILTLLDDKTYLTGNIGKVQPFEIIDQLSANDKVVYELSSFQLQDLTISPHIAVVLMVTEDHLDYHKNLNEYHEAKSSIVKFQNSGDWAIINADYNASIQIGEKGNGNKIFFSRKQPLKKGLFWDGNTFQVVNEDSLISIPTSLTKRSWQLRGDHNIENIAAAISAAALSGATRQQIEQGLASFTGLEFRLQKVREYNGITFYNDSFSTVPDTSMAALRSFDEPVIMIVGGSEKGADYNELSVQMASSNNLKAVIAIGKTGQKISDLLAKNGYKGKIFGGGSSMKEIMKQAKTVAEKGDIVLLSPGCASFDMFKNYKDRGVQFNNEAMDWEQL